MITTSLPLIDLIEIRRSRSIADEKSRTLSGVQTTFNSLAPQRSRRITVVNWRESLFNVVFQFVRLSRLDRLLLSGDSYPIALYFKGIEALPVVKEILGEETKEVLKDLRVRFTWMGGYMRVDPRRRAIVISSRYLADGDRLDIYLDLVHELMHVKQLMEGKDLYDIHYSYTERQTEIDAYRVAVKEARRKGLNDDRICRYLKTEWISDQDLRRLAATLKVKCPDLASV